MLTPMKSDFSYSFRKSRRAAVSSACSLLLAATGWGQAPGDLTREELLRRVVTYNESVQVRILEAEISRHTAAAERGIFEPQVTGSVEHVDSARPNNSQQIAALGLSPVTILTERNTIYNTGIEGLTDFGTKLRAGLTVRHLHNNIQQKGEENESFVGLSFTQPLLKNGGRAATMAKIRLSAVASDMTFQEYRKQLMLVVSQAEVTYWDLYLSQEQERIGELSVESATKILNDSKARAEVGKGTQTDVLQAEAAVTQRQAKATENRFKRLESVSKLLAFYSDGSVSRNLILKAVDQPVLPQVILDQDANTERAFKSNPDYLIRKSQLEQDNIRLGYARNQRRPQVDLKGSYGFNGLGHTLDRSLDSIEGRENQAWSVAVEWNLPLFGGVKERHELDAARLARSRSLLAVQEAEVQIANAIASSMTKLRTYLENQFSHQKVIKNLEQLLQAQIAKMEAGSLENRFVLETEDKLSEARVALVEDLVQYNRALIDLDLIRGTTLQVRHLDLTREDLHERTRGLFAAHRWSGGSLGPAQNRPDAANNP